jgi:hypothetical protein
MATGTKHDWEEKIDNDLFQIAKELLRGRIGFLFGAGMSIPSGGLPGTALAKELLVQGLFPAQARKPDPDLAQRLDGAAGRYPLEAIAAGVVRRLPFQEQGLVRLLNETVFGGKEPACHNGHRQVASIVNRLGNIRLLFTTNWDSLLEKAFGESAAPIWKDDQLVNLDDLLAQKVGIVHLHGTFDDNPLIREDDLMNPAGPFFQLFLSELMSKSFVFVGYSLSDPNIRALYYKAASVLAARTANLHKTTFVVCPPRDDVDRLVATHVWDARNATYIPLGGEEFFDRLKNELETQAMEHFKRELEKRLGVTREELNAKIDELVSVFPDFETREQALLYLYSITKTPKAK